MRRATALPVVLSLVLAGCLSAIDVLPPRDLSNPGAVPLVAALNAVVDPAGGMGEPSLGVAPDGTLWTNGRDWVSAIEHTVGDRRVRVDSGSVYRSKYDGATWERVAAPAAPWPNLDPDLVVDRDGTLWYSILWVGCSTVAVSRDAGETWTQNPLACNGPVGDRQYVIPTQGGTAYIYYHQLPTFWHTAAKTTDHGRTWLPSGPVETPTHHLLLTGGSAWGGGGFWNAVTGSVFLTFTWHEGAELTGGRSGWHPSFAVTHDGGLTWEIGKLPNAGGAYLGLSLVVGAADEAGNVYLAWAERSPEDEGRVYLAVSTDDGRTWSEPKRVDEGPGSKVFPALAVQGPGRVAVAWYGTSVPGHPGEVGDDAYWNVTLAWTSDALAATPAWSRGNLSETPAKKGPVCVNGSGCGGNRQLLDYFSAKPLADGRVAAVWASTVVEEGKVVNVVGLTRDAVLASG